MYSPPVVIVGARPLRETSLVPLVKFVLLAAIATVATFALSATVFRRVPILRAIL
jgi:hypothetical protein